MEPGEGTIALLVFGQSDQLKWQPRVVEGRAPRQQTVLLKHGGDLAAEVIEVRVRTFVSDTNEPFRGRFEADHQVEKSRLSATGLPDDCHHLARRNVEIETVDCDHGLPGGGLPEHFAQPAHFDWWRATHVRHRNTRASTRATIASSRNSNATSTSVQANTSATENSSCATES